MLCVRFSLSFFVLASSSLSWYQLPEAANELKRPWRSERVFHSALEGTRVANAQGDSECSQGRDSSWRCRKTVSKLSVTQPCHVLSIFLDELLHLRFDSAFEMRMETSQVSFLKWITSMESRLKRNKFFRDRMHGSVFHFFFFRGERRQNAVNQSSFMDSFSFIRLCISIYSQSLLYWTLSLPFVASTQPSFCTPSAIRIKLQPVEKCLIIWTYRTAFDSSCFFRHFNPLFTAFILCVFPWYARNS